MGAGKSTVGHILAGICGFRFVDIDALIVSMRGKPINDIFAEEGEEAFRNYETEALQSLEDISGAVVATGGGIVLRPENRMLLKYIGIVVYLRASFDTLLERVSQSDQRPLADLSNGADRLKGLLESRKSVYEEADIVADTDGFDGNQVAIHILERLKKVSRIDR